MENEVKKREKIIIGRKIYKDFDIETGQVKVLYNNSFEVERGKFAIIFGPSGSGKSTLLNIILGLEKPTSGELILLNTDIYNDLDSDGRINIRKHKIGIITQQQNWIKSLNVLENVAFPLALQGVEYHERLSRAMKYLRLVGMMDRADFIPTQLSGGEQQKVALARCLINDPELIVADEPTGNLDMKSGDELMKILINLVNEGKTVLMVTHNIDYIEKADQVLHVREGQIIDSFSMDRDSVDMVKSELMKKTEEFEDRLERDKKLVPKVFNNVVKTKGRIKNFLKCIPCFFRQSDKLKNILDYIYLMLPTNAIKSVIALTFYGLDGLAGFLMGIRFIPNFIKYSIINRTVKFFSKLENMLEARSSDRIRTFDLVEMSFRNLTMKRTRTIITIGGMAIGISVIVFLLSIGFGLERLVINEAIKTSELNQIDAIPSINGDLVIDKGVVEDVLEVDGVDKILTQANLAGKINYKGSNSDVIVYAVNDNYIKDADIHIIKQNEVKKFQTQEDGINKFAIVNVAFLEMFGIDANESMGENFNLKFVISKDLIKGEEEDKITEDIKFEIIALTDAGTSPFLYVPLEEVEREGLNAYSQLKIIVDSTDNVNPARDKLEVLGLTTTSSVDTMNEIEQIFSILRRVLFVIGVAALSIASLGMINTLTISLLERTKEVSLMKTIGMRSEEIEELFVTESLMMGLAGGLVGLVVGLVGGKLLSLAISVWAIGSGYQAIDVAFLPIGLSILVVFLASFVGNLTGIYPAKRAKAISPIDALRYE